MRGRTGWLITTILAAALLPATLVTAGSWGATSPEPPEPIDPVVVDVTFGPPLPPDTVTPTTTLPEPPEGTFNPECVWVVRPGDSISLIANHVGGLGIGELLSENLLGRDAVIHAGDLIDICPGNEISDVTGASLLRPPTTLIADHDPDAVRRQQEHLNRLFDGYGIAPLAVDGQSGRLTRQQLCAARVLLGLPVSRSDMAAGSEEEAALLALQSVPLPPTGPRPSGRWAFIDITCQVMFVGDSSGVRFVFATSTGERGFDTRIVSGVRAFRFDPAADNNGWHDSSEFPSGFDNPLNGNMYKPIYFSNGQAIHGANNVPTSPASKGCVRLRVSQHDQLVAWLGLADETIPVWRESTIGLRVTTRGAYLPDP